MKYIDNMKRKKKNLGNEEKIRKNRLQIVKKQIKCWAFDSPVDRK